MEGGAWWAAQTCCIPVHFKNAKLPPTAPPAWLCPTFLLSFEHILPFTRSISPESHSFHHISPLRHHLLPYPAPYSINEPLLTAQTPASATWVSIMLHSNCLFACFSPMIMKSWENCNSKWNQMIRNGKSYTCALRRMEFKKWDWFLYMPAVLKTKTYLWTNEYLLRISPILKLVNFLPGLSLDFSLFPLSPINSAFADPRGLTCNLLQHMSSVLVFFNFLFFIASRLRSPGYIFRRKVQS